MLESNYLNKIANDLKVIAQNDYNVSVDDISETGPSTIEYIAQLVHAMRIAKTGSPASETVYSAVESIAVDIAGISGGASSAATVGSALVGSSTVG